MLHRCLLLTFVLGLATSSPLRAESFSQESISSPAEELLPSEPEFSASADDNGLSTPDDLLPECDLCSPASPLPERSTYVFADLLYWSVSEGGADNWAQEYTPVSQQGTTLGMDSLVDAPFAWNAGVRVGLGTQSCDDGYDAKLYYTNFQTQANNQAVGDVYSAFLGNFYVGNADGTGFGPHYRSANIQWDFAFHSLDFELGHKYQVAPKLVLRPFVGLKAAIVNQSIRSNWYDPIDTAQQTYLFTAATENLKQNFWGIGPSLGVTMTIPLVTNSRYALKIYGTPSGALMFGHWTFKDQYQNNGWTSISVPVPSSVAINLSPINGATTMARGEMGIEWARYLARATTTVRLGYEAQVWLNQMQLYSLNGGRLNNLMALQGAVVELGISF